MTAAIIAKELGVNKIKINYLFFESCKQWIYDSNPVGRLIVDKYSLEEIRSQYLQNIGVETTEENEILTHWKDEMSVRYPESNNDVIERTSLFADYFSEQ